MVGKRKKTDVDNKAYRFQIKPTKEQTEYFDECFGCCRFIWNKMLADKKKYYELTGRTLDITPAYYKNKLNLYWLKDVDALALTNVQLNLDKAYKEFFKGNTGFPKFKKKYQCKDSFTTNLVNDNISFEKGMLTIPKLDKPIKVVPHRTFKDGGILKRVTITREPNGNYYASLMFEYEKKENNYELDINNSVGLDMSMQELYVSSDNEYGNYPRFYRQMQKRLAKEQHKLSEMEYKSNNYIKQQKKVAKLHAKIKHQREDFLHKASRNLVNKYDYIFVEDLDMRAMAQTLNLGKSVCDNGWGMFVRMLDYKLYEKGGKLIKIDKWYPSSKTCSKCGHKNKDLTLLDRTFVCPECGFTIDRDFQAALNIRNEGLRSVA